MKKRILRFTALTISWAMIVSGSFSFADDVKRISKEALKAMLGKPELILLDVRIGKDWNASEHKVQGALREDPQSVDAWADKYDKEKTVVIYCA
ncbi:MAG: hypothetical protein K9N21_05275 [Deltaproteobacteria bacterium]|nr:hypothetical protein [Deltaproteobacteria bacterium]